MQHASKFKELAGGVAAAAALILATPTEAATIIQDFGRSALNPNNNGQGQFSLNMFNGPSLGTLNSVTIELWARTATDHANPNPIAGLAQFTTKGSILISSADASAPIISGWEGLSGSLQNTLNPYYATEVNAGKQVTVLSSPEDISKFIGSGSYLYNIQSGVEILSSSGALIGEALPINRSNPYLTIKYDYTEAVTPPVSAIPEPGTWALMISGFGVAGAMLRRNRKAANDAAPAPTIV